LQIGATDIWLDFDPTVIESVSISRTGLTTDYAWEKAVIDTDTGKRVKIAAIQDANPPELHGNGSLFWLTFDMVGSAGSSTSLDVKEFISGVGGGGSTIYTPDDLINAIPLTIEDGLLEVEEDVKYILGDVNGNGVVQAVDALFALRIASGEIEPTLEQRYAGDSNGNGVVQSADASMILYHAAFDSWPTPPSGARTRTVQAMATSSVALSDGTAQPGGTVDITLTATNLQNMAGAEFVIVYDTTTIAGLEKVELTGLADGFTNIYSRDDKQGRIFVTLADKAEISGTGALLKITLRLSEQATMGAETPLSLVDAKLNDLYGRDFVTSFANNSISRQSATITVGGPSVYLPVVVK
jgi:hypothetical protein